jgi:hypothetical protein
MLLPALQQARAKGQATTCVNKLKQILTYANMYTMDNNDYILPLRRPQGGAEVNWPQLLNLYRGLTVRHSWAAEDAKREGMEFFYCASNMKLTYPNFVPGSAVYSNYSANAFIMADFYCTDERGNYKKVGSVKNASRTIMFADGNGLNFNFSTKTHVDLTSTQPLIGFIHTQLSTNAGFLDGSVGSYKHNLATYVACNADGRLLEK